MIPKEILQQIRRIQITTSRMVTNVFAGQYQSVFKGRGMEFNEVRQYQPGDDIQSIDWNVTARVGTPYIKKFVEERELTVMLLLDMSQSCYFGTVNKLKRHLAAEICSVLAFSAIQNNDKVGLIAFTDRIEKYVPPRKGLHHVLRIIREALYFNPDGKGTDIPLALEYLSNVVRHKSVAFILSDFYDHGFEIPLSIVNKRHDVTAITITDPSEISLPEIGMIQFDDAETGEQFLIDSSNAIHKAEFKKKSQNAADKLRKTFSRINVDSISIRSDIPYAKSLFKFFKMRERRRR